MIKIKFTYTETHTIIKRMLHTVVQSWHGMKSADGVGNTSEESPSIFSLIWMY